MESNLPNDIKAFTSRQLLAYIALFVLLAIRILVADPVSNLAQLLGISGYLSEVEVLKVIPGLAGYLFFSWSFIFIGIVIVISRDDLTSLNVDEAFISVFFAGSLTYWMYENRWPFGWIGLLVSAVIYILYKKREFRFTKLEPIAVQTAMIVMIMFLLGLMLKRDSLSIGSTLSLIRFAAADIPFVVIEEVIFRGLLWKFLANLNWSAPRIVAVQAFLFWFSHIDSMLAYPFFFWILTPLAGIVLGIIVWRSKSLSVSSLAHILINFLIRLSRI